MSDSIPADIPAEDEPWTPVVNQGVHYVSFGTPNGEYQSRCRAADVTEVGAWITNPNLTKTVADYGDQKIRTITQEWDPLACALFVKNPTGMFFNTCQYAPHSLTEPKGGTWHWATPACM